MRAVVATLSLALSACAIVPASRASWHLCANAGVMVDIDFANAGIHRCVVDDKGNVVVAVDHEPAFVEGINPSPWYALRITTHQPRAITLTLDYTDHEHRYPPLTSPDGKTWTSLPADRLKLNEKKTRATLTLGLRAGETWLAGQPIVTAQEGVAWTRNALKGTSFREQNYGSSRKGAPLTAFISDAPPGADMIVALTRQHPPETSGQDAFRAFVEQLTTRRDPAAVKFRATHKLLLAPMPNPDGVDGGHWRLNAGGVDLNRDWGPFTQPETRALSDLILKQAAGRRVVSMMDFHSTFRTTIYCPPMDVASPSPTIGFLTALKSQMDTAITPSLPWSCSHNANGGTSKAWALEVLKAPGITVELADDIPLADAKTVGRTAADALIAYFTN